MPSPQSPDRIFYSSLMSERLHMPRRIARLNDGRLVEYTSIGMATEYGDERFLGFGVPINPAHYPDLAAANQILSRMPRQRTPYTCGPAAIEAAAIVQGRPLTFDEISAGIDVDPVCGTSNEDMLTMARMFLTLSPDQERWHGGLAIANIRNPFSGIGHYVLLVDEIDGRIRYWCPLHGNVFSVPKSELIWTSGDGVYKNWFINLEPGTADLLEMQRERFAFIIADPKETLNCETDTSLLIEKAYQDEGTTVFWVHSDEISLIDQTLYLKGMPVNEFSDRVWIRLDPVNTVRYYETLRLLASVVEDVVFLNDPTAILEAHDKLVSIIFREYGILTTASSEAALKNALKHIDWRRSPSAYVIKSPSRFGGQSMRRCQTHEEALAAFHELVDDSGYVIVEPFIQQEGNPVDTRVFVANGKVIGAVNRVAANGEWRCNIHAGATVRKTDMSTIPDLAFTAAEALKNAGVFCAGLDFLNGELTEVNVSCPSAIPQINEVDQVNLEKTLIREGWLYRCVPESGAA